MWPRPFSFGLAKPPFSFRNCSKRVACMAAVYAVFNQTIEHGQLMADITTPIYRTLIPYYELHRPTACAVETRKMHSEKISLPSKYSYVVQSRPMKPILVKYRLGLRIC